MDSVYLFNKYGTPISYDFWQLLRRLVNWVCDNWRSDDWGIWEVRGNERQFVYSKLMCWVAVDRALRLADKRSLPADRSKWLRVRDEIFMDIMENGWDDSLQSFVQSYGSSTLDASTLMMPLVLFLSPTDPPDDQDPGSHKAVAGQGRPGIQRPGLSLQHQPDGGWPAR